MDNKELINFFENNFGIQASKLEMDTESAFFKHVQTVLSHRIKFLIRTDLDKLLQILYRIDLDQGLTDQAFELGEINRISDFLAEKIIVRQIQKIEYSKNFYNKDS